jgi:hypothetical protein
MIRIPSWFAVLLALVVVGGLVGVAVADEAKGKIKSAKDTEVVVTVGEKDTTFAVNDKTKITVGGKAAKASDLKAGAEATVTYTKDGGKNVASAIDVK